MEKLKVEYVDIGELKPYKNNAKLHTQEQIDQIKESISQFGMNDPIGVWKDGLIIEGHGRWMALCEMGAKEVPVIHLDHLTDEERRAYTLAHNKLTTNTGYDMELLDFELDAIEDIDMTAFGFDLGGVEDEEESCLEETRSRLADRFIIPPFDVFDAKQGDWAKRKKEWHSIIKDDLSARSNVQIINKIADAPQMADASLLDPVMAEIICSWFLPHKECNVVDCFAGDTVFGFVSSYLGHNFTGIELRKEQVDFNNERTNERARYFCDDGRNILRHVEIDSQDLIFSCPPYFDLEVYSDDANDASNQDSYEDFYAILDAAFTAAVRTLKNNRFAVIVVGDVRDKKTGAYYNFPADVINTFQNNGMILYNNIKLLTPYGTAQVRAGRYMRNRKTAHVYQDILVFYKGDTGKIKDEFGEVEVKELESEDMEL